MMPVSKHGDPQLGVDIHLCVVPPSPSPVPLPTPHTSIVFDPFDYVPIIGATVTVCGMKRATAGTNGIAIHIPPGFPFAPKLPDKDDELFMGSATVVADGDPLSFIAVPVLSCQVAGMMSPFRLKKKGGPKAMVLPTVFNLAIPTTVFVGGPPTISLMGLAFKGAFAALGKFAKSGLFKRMRQRLFQNLRPGFLRCTILRAEPVNILTGEVVLHRDDFTIHGRIPIVWTRAYASEHRRAGACGYGWETPADIRLEVAADGSVWMRHPSVGPLSFARVPLSIGRRHVELELMDGSRLTDEGQEYCVSTHDGLSYYFPKSLARTGAHGVVEQPLARISDRSGNWLQFERRGDVLTAIQESSGRRLEFETVNGRIETIAWSVPEDSDRDVSVRYRYDTEGNLASVVDSLGKAHAFVYDEHRLVRHTSRSGLSFHYEYDRSPDDGWRVRRSWGDGGLLDYRFDYDELLNERRITDSLGNVSIVALDTRGLPIAEIDPLGGMTIYEYDEAGHTIAVVNPDGMRTEFVYDESGNLCSELHPDGARIASTFDELGHPVRTTDARGNVWEQEWDERGQLICQRTPLGHETRYVYDALGDITRIVNALGAGTELRYDPYGNLSEVRDASGARTRYAYDRWGDLRVASDPLGRETAYAYDARRRLLSTRRPSGAMLRFAYDADGRLARYVDENGQAIALEYVGLGEISERGDPDGSMVRYRYDSEERLIGVVNQRNETYHLRRDALGRIVEEEDYWGQRRRYRYSPGGRLEEAIDPHGTAVVFTTDARGRVIAKAVRDDSETVAAPFETFAYDATGNLVGCANADVQIERVYDADGRLIEERQGEGVSIRNSYDAVGNRVRREIATPAAPLRRVDYEYDLLDQVQAIRADDHHPITIEHDRAGQMRRQRLNATLLAEFEYTPDGYLARRTLSHAQRRMVDVAFSYDPVGNLVERRDDDLGVDRYTYDPMRRIREHRGRRGVHASHYLDPAGSALALTPAGGDSDLPERLQPWLRVGALAAARYTFDRAGRLTTRVDHRGTLMLSWDATNRLVETRSGLRASTYRYDPLGRRIEKRSADGAVAFVWDGDVLAADITRSGAGGAVQRRDWIHLPDTFIPLAVTLDAGTPSLLYYQTDPNGAASHVTDGSGAVKWVAEDLVSGMEAAATQEFDNPLRLQGQYFDEETGLAYNRYRYFSPEIDQFISQDPIGLAGGENPYSYGRNVLGWVDPLGLADFPVSSNTALPDVLTRGVHVNVHDVPGHGSVHVGVRPDHLGGIALVPADPATKAIAKSDPSLWKKITGSVEEYLSITKNRKRLAAVANAAKKAFVQRGAEFAHLARNLLKGCG